MIRMLCIAVVFLELLGGSAFSQHGRKAHPLPSVLMDTLQVGRLEDARFFTTEMGRGELVAWHFSIRPNAGQSVVIREVALPMFGGSEASQGLFPSSLSLQLWSFELSAAQLLSATPDFSSSGLTVTPGVNQTRIARFVLSESIEFTRETVITMGIRYNSGDTTFGSVSPVFTESERSFEHFFVDSVLTENQTLVAQASTSDQFWQNTSVGDPIFEVIVDSLGDSGTITNNEPEHVPQAFELTAFPNPFNPETTIRVRAEPLAQLLIRISDSVGRLVQTQRGRANAGGSYQLRFDASGLSSGIYFIEVQSRDARRVKAITLLK